MRRLRATLAPKKKVMDVRDQLKNRGKERSDGKDLEEETVEYTQDRSLPTEEVQEGEASGMDGEPGKKGKKKFRMKKCRMKRCRMEKRCGLLQYIGLTLPHYIDHFLVECSPGLNELK